MMKRHLPILLILFCSLFTETKAQTSSGFTMEDLHQTGRYCRSLLLSDTAYATEQSYRLTDDIKYNTDAKGYFHTLTPEGSWPDINYQSQMRGAWRPSWHLYRIMLLYREYHKNKDPRYLQAVHNALNFWTRADFQCENWWQNQINVPYVYSSLMIMLGDQAKPQELDYLKLKLVKRIPVYKPTGQNLIWQLDNQARVAIIQQDTAAFPEIIRQMQAVINISSKEGIQPDYAFQQHGKMLQFGNYGMHFVNSLLFWIKLTDHTPVQFEQRKKQIIFDYCAKGLRWTVFKKSMDLTAVGRQIRKYSGIKRGMNLYDDFAMVSASDPAHAFNYTMDGFSYPGKPAPLLKGNKSFWSSDYMVQLKQDSYMMSVKTHGSFVKRIESINTENLKGAFLDDGVTLIQRTGQEYKNIEPLWNWSMLPGTTADTTIRSASKAAVASANHSGFVGQVSNTVAGISTMEYDRLGLKGLKSYFFTGNLMVCLGAGISHANLSDVVTTVNQRIINPGQPLLSGKTRGKSWLWQDSIAYFFPGVNQQVQSRTVSKTGNWKDIDEASGDQMESGTVLTIFLAQQQHDNYAYGIIPGMSLKETQKTNWTSKIQLLENSAGLQAIQVNNSKMLVFHQPGKVSFKDKIQMEAGSPCLVIAEKTGTQLSLWIADPTRKLERMTLTINGKTHEIIFPRGDLAGSALKQNLVL